MQVFYVTARRLFWVLRLCFFPISAQAEGMIIEPPLDTQAQAVMAQWFSVDTNYDLSVSVSAAKEESHGERRALTFTSDDGQQVHGSIALPKHDKSPKRLALLLHPMGQSEKLWWHNGNPIAADKVTQYLLAKGYVVLALDAREHGKRSRGLHPKQILTIAHSDSPRRYVDMVVGTVRDYRLALAWAKAEFKIKDGDILSFGYSMGAQMALLLASFEPSIRYVAAAVPPYVNRSLSPVAPRHHVGRLIEREVLLLAAEQDAYTKVEQMHHLASLVSSDRKQLVLFDSGHLLPTDYQQHIFQFVDQHVDQGSL